MKPNKILNAQIIQGVERQLKSNDPVETKQTFDCLVNSGISKADAKMYVAQCVAVEIFNVLKYQEPFNHDRFVKNLNKLPNPPFED